MAATIKMVAAKAGVSVATVSKYINGGNVIEENRMKVQSAIDELDYKINEVARSLKINKTYTVGILASSIKSYFVAGVISSMQYTLLNQGYSSIIVDFQEDRGIENRQLETLLKRQVDGIIIFPLENEKTVIEFIQQKKIPVVIVDNFIEDIECDAVLSDSRQGIKTGVTELIQSNYKNIGMITGPESMYTARERLQGYVDALTEHEVLIQPSLMKYSDYNLVGGYQSMKEFLAMKNRPDAMVVANYYMAIGALKALKEEEVRIPQDMALLTFDELDFLCILDAEIKVICQPVSEMGIMTAERIIQRINGDMEGFPKVDKLMTMLI